MTPNASPIVIDGVFFQIGRSGIARVWQSLLSLWADTPFADRLVVMDRARTAPRVPGIRYHDTAGLNYNDLEGDRRIVQDVCDEVGAALFMSTYYSYPKTTPSMAMVYDMIPEVMGYDLTTPMWRQKREALAYAGSYTAISHSTARDLARFAGKPVDVRVDYTGSDFAPVSAGEVADFRRRHGIVRPYFMTSGSRADYKNAALFFSAFAASATRARTTPSSALAVASSTRRARRPRARPACTSRSLTTTTCAAPMPARSRWCTRHGMRASACRCSRRWPASARRSLRTRPRCPKSAATRCSTSSSVRTRKRRPSSCCSRCNGPRFARA